ncbi:MAG: DUF4013 domain-containing protein [Methanobrevibacter sp.]|nr:DUF4013 domain-containing protein [Methanobrevibacter sp.]
MEVVELFKDALTYPTKDFSKLLILGVLAFVATIPFFVMVLPLFFGSDVTALAGMAVIGLLGALLVLILDIIYAGYGLNIIKKTIALEEGLPEFDWGQMIIDGIKVFILGIIYAIIPTILSAIIGFLGIGLSTFAISADSMSTFLVANFFVFFIIGIIYLIFGLLYIVALGRFAETDSLGAALNVMDVFDKIGQIGWGNYILWIIVLLILQFVLNFVAGILLAIVIGVIIVAPFFLMYYSRAIGLLYNESKNY